MEQQAAITLFHRDPEQPRKNFDMESLRELSKSILRHGVIQPIVVRPHPKREGEYLIVAGERRWRAAKLAKLDVLPYRMVKEGEGVDIRAIQAAENLQRQDLTPFEYAQSAQNWLSEANPDGSKRVQKDLVAAFGRNSTFWSRILRLNSCDPRIAELTKNGAVTNINTLSALVAISQLDPERFERVVSEIEAGTAPNNLERHTARQLAIAKWESEKGKKLPLPNAHGVYSEYEAERFTHSAPPAGNGAYGFGQVCVLEIESGWIWKCSGGNFSGPLMDREEDRCETREEAIKRGAEAIYNRAYNDAVNAASKVGLKCYKSLLKWAAELAGIEPADVDAERSRVEEERLAQEQARLEESRSLNQSTEVQTGTGTGDESEEEGEQTTREPASTNVVAIPQVAASNISTKDASRNEDQPLAAPLVAVPASIAVQVVPDGVELVIDGVKKVLTVDMADFLSDKLMSAVMTRREQQIRHLPVIRH
ncbi:ParB/RepB/Spo0J family partition protein [Aeromonas veronii]|uniref:ParB/RepB/Spo0J family partition protein n=1 Tax=Aeromonas hydrophila TaxID=644 RepID=UPI001C5A5EA0|nr:ParB/RepB/Spo0J family partition protein [Aeromonas hydrophila]MBW3834714.1 ParB/RepB/Spo0J family partition protein [Aeromonas hydrophila]MBW5280378.1 ParB/RepB/Spo0J family partition protein [Aeromonas hydrophila]